jgi:hypothetical protein
MIGFVGEAEKNTNRVTSESLTIGCQKTRLAAKRLSDVFCGASALKRSAASRLRTPNSRLTITR